MKEVTDPETLAAITILLNRLGVLAKPGCHQGIISCRVHDDGRITHIQHKDEDGRIVIAELDANGDLATLMN